MAAGLVQLKAPFKPAGVRGLLVHTAGKDRRAGRQGKQKVLSVPPQPPCNNCCELSMQEVEMFRVRSHVHLAAFGRPSDSVAPRCCPAISAPPTDR